MKHLFLLLPRFSPSLVALGALAGLAARAPAQLTFNVSAMIQEQGKRAGSKVIGAIDVREGAGRRSVFADFRFDPMLGPWLDGWHDFRWIHVERFYSPNGTTVLNSRRYGPLPAIAPQAVGHPTGGSDEDPFVHTTTEWVKRMRQGSLAEFRKEGEFVGFTADVGNEPAPTGGQTTTIVYKTFLVAVPISTKAFAKHQLCVLAGFEWTYQTAFSATSGQSHTITLGPQLDPQEGVNLIPAAIANATPAFAKPSASGPGWTAITGCTLVQCPKQTSLGTVPSNGIPEGWYAMSTFSTGTPGQLGGIQMVDPTGAQAPVQVQGLPARLTGQGAPPTAFVGVGGFAVTGPDSSTIYAGSITNPSTGGIFDTAELHEITVDRQGQVTNDQVIDTVGPSSGSDPIGFYAFDTVPRGDQGRDDDLVYGIDDDDDDDFTVPDFGYYDALTGAASRLGITGALPQGNFADLAVDGTGSTIYALFAHVDPMTGFETGTGEIVAISIADGATEPVAMLPKRPQKVVCDRQSGLLHVTAIALSSFQPSYYQVDPATGAVAEIPQTLGLGGPAALAFEDASGELILTNGRQILRMTQAGAVSTVFGVGGTFGFGFPTALQVIPSPRRFGNGTPTTFGVDFDLPPRRAAVRGGIAELPLAGNGSYAFSLSSTGDDVIAAVGIAGGRLPEPGFPLLGVDVLLDLSAPHLFVPVAGGPTVLLPLPIPAGFPALHLFAQAFFLDDGNLGATPGFKITTIRR